MSDFIVNAGLLVPIYLTISLKFSKNFRKASKKTERGTVQSSGQNQIELGALECGDELVLRDLSVVVGVDELEDVVGLGGAELHAELLEDELQELVGLLAVEVSALVGVEGAPDVVDYLTNASGHCVYNFRTKFKYFSSIKGLSN